MVLLRHVHIPGLTTYAHASNLQGLLVDRLLRHKAHVSSLPSPSSTSPVALSLTPPPPTIITFTPQPIYTTGRRETTPPSPSQLQFLQRPLETQHGAQIPGFEHAMRGGQITFHGPGQLVIYPILSLSHPYSFAPSHARTAATSSPASPGDSCAMTRTPTRLSPRCYVHLLESTTISTLAHYHISSMRTSNPGVWINDDLKIAALGVHLRRNVTSHGVGLNVHTDLRWFERIVACGLEGKAVTSMWGQDTGLEASGLRTEEVAGVWVGEFAKGVGLTEGDVVLVSEDEVLKEVEEIEIGV